MWGYDLTGGFRIGKLHKRVTQAEALEYMPTLPAKNLVSGYLYFDAAADDARLVMAICRTAALHHGAVVANRVAAVGSRARRRRQHRRGHRRRRRRAVRPSTPAPSSTPPACGPTRSAPSTRAHDPDSIRPAKGIHITVPHHLVRNDHRRRSSRSPRTSASVFVVPAGRPFTLHRHHRHRLRRLDRRPAVHRGGHRLPARAPSTTRCTDDHHPRRHRRHVGRAATAREVRPRSGRTADLSRGHTRPPRPTPASSPSPAAS